MKPYDADLKPLEERLDFAAGEVQEEILLASEQNAYSSRELQLTHYYEYKRDISLRQNEVRKARTLQRIKARADILFQTKQTEALAEIERLLIQRREKDEGNQC